MASIANFPVSDNPKPLPLDPPEPVTAESVRREQARMHLLRAAYGYCPLCTNRLQADGSCPDPYCLCNWWGKDIENATDGAPLSPSTIGDPRR